MRFPVGDVEFIPSSRRQGNLKGRRTVVSGLRWFERVVTPSPSAPGRPQQFVLQLRASAFERPVFLFIGRAARRPPTAFSGQKGLWSAGPSLFGRSQTACTQHVSTGHFDADRPPSLAGHWTDARLHRLPRLSTALTRLPCARSRPPSRRSLRSVERGPSRSP
jgi:hypothetical protein